ncbi:hypothetical protein K8O68_08155 [Salipaludibacillus sp. CUR1]|uniref:hypothetical protein n=1 Tax=Salipaludibacillus sp. CUR1 TaxID=2820003 RepID=UPI001E5652B4|nr:hypothetical protein [Salipaludibacillus sp. CUR1]MCE7792388.1 hypothetical protein [Salipaludibacillus sp. CUR1]
MKYVLGKEEQIVKESTFRPNLVLSWLKSEMTVTNKRVLGYSRNTLLGLIPLGKNEISYPLKNISSVSISSKFYLSRFIIGLILVLSGLSQISDSFLGGLFFLVLGALPLANSFVSRLIISPNSGNPTKLDVTFLDKNTIQEFSNEVNVTITDIA